ncbi:MAG: hypothetical protein AVDCRST_MAG38-2195 [uncultured Solirubrobacteraceae bacterium]|uniref:Uncharacterized protein n=1 Tax=uncultured Solirubrobacteraceae bacterium TaxID=1162706 RepID=A0A6J4S560_9ACTN|nr:MAG: hypothetical protein AVDCRST_MAG38-2195 [uncultured Solirubrobacteraceae bacterium]
MNNGELAHMAAAFEHQRDLRRTAERERRLPRRRHRISLRKRG